MTIPVPPGPVVSSMRPSMAPDGRPNLSDYPEMARGLDGAYGTPLQDELEAFLTRFRAKRVPRRRCDVVAKLIWHFRDQGLMETVVVKDISETGLQIAGHRSTEISANDLGQSTFIVRVTTPEGERHLELSAHRVCRVSVTLEYRYFAFQFDGLSSSEAVFLYNVRHPRQPA
ncbi:MAG: PilZ domain-containing protein [Polyangiaceae bacterium]|nr:PilZ domain-containing protein [Polyangiaceae bacterium]